MQLNGSTGPTMAASEPPEPPPRNPDRINASLNKLSETKITKSLDSNDRSVNNNNNKSLRTILSLDTNSSSNCSNSTVVVSNVTTQNLSAKTQLPSKTITVNSNLISNNIKKNEIINQNSSVISSLLLSSTIVTTTNSSSLSSSSSSSTSSSSAFVNISNLKMTTTPMISKCSATSLTTPTSMVSTTASVSVAASTATACNTTTTTTTNTTSTTTPVNTNTNNAITSEDIGIGNNQKSFSDNMSNVNNQILSNIQSELINGTSIETESNNLKQSDEAGNRHYLITSGNQQSSVRPIINGHQLMNNQISKDDSGNGGGGNSSNDSSNGCGGGVNKHKTTDILLLDSNNTKEDGYCDSNRNDDLRLDSMDKDNKDQNQTMRLKHENERLTAEIARFRKLLENSPDGAVGGIDLSDSNSYDAHSTDGSTSRIERLEAELKAAKTQIAALRAERKKLKSDKNDLLAHVRQLCASLQDKEQELRDFIRNYEQRIRETETNNAKMSSERERERWSLLKHARDEAERSLALAQQLNARDIQLQRTQEQLQEARRQLSGCLSDQESLLSFAPLTPPSGLMTHLTGTSTTVTGFSGTSNDRGSCSADSGVRGSSDRESTTGDLNLSDGTCENGPCITVDPDSISLVSSQHMYQFGTPKERSPTLSPLNSGAYSSRSVEQLGSPVDLEGPSALTRKFINKNNSGTLGPRMGRGGTWGSISRVFARNRNKNKTAPQEIEGLAVQDFSWSPLSEEGYAEKLRLLREASTIPMERWRASQVLAWLEVALGMPQYSTRCSENVKSGKVLLELNDTELETGLGLTHPMHRKKLRLAIEEQRRPDLVRYPNISQLGHTWVASEWLPDIGLPQYAESFIHSLVDARMLDTLSKKELEKFLGVTRKFHQASIVHGIHVLRIIKYDRQTLAMRRLQSENVDADPIVWTNQRFIRWARSIDLGEYADNLKDSGVHGGLVVLEPSFSGDTMATALGIPPSKNIIRRHLATEFDGLILPARATLGQGIRSGCGVVPITGPGGLQQHYATGDRRSSGSLRISAWKGSQGSLSKAFRFNTKSRTDKSNFGNSTSPTPSYSSSSEGGIYATIGPSPILPPPPPPTTAPPPPPPSHRVSAPPTAESSSSTSSVHNNSNNNNVIQSAYGQHRRVKSISDIEVVAATPV